MYLCLLQLPSSLAQTSTPAPGRPTPSQTASPILSQPSPRGNPAAPRDGQGDRDAKGLEEAKSALTQLTDEFSMYRREKAENDK